MTTQLTIQLLNGCNVQVAGKQLNGFQQPRLQALLAYLLLHRDAPQPRQQIAFLFWPDSSEKQARTNLRKLLLQLRRVLPDAAEFLIDTQQTVQWNPNAPVWLDVAELESLLDQVQALPADLTLLSRLSDLYQGELLPNAYEDWIIARRQNLHALVTRALGQLVNRLEEVRAYEEGILYAQRLLHLDPLAEASYLRLMRLRALSGDRTGALQTYHDCVATLRRELDIEPDADMQALAKQLQAGIPLADTPEPPAQGVALDPTAPDPTVLAPMIQEPAIRGLRMPTTPCIGRSADLQRLTQQLATPYCRLLTLYGPGGIGKTRLAVALAEEVQQRFRHGVAFVAMASLRTPETIAPAIAAVLGLHLVEGRRPETQLLAHLREQELLLILDNAEHLLTEESADSDTIHDPNPSEQAIFTVYRLIEQLLDAAPALKIVVTSREPLALYEEHTYEVHGLSLSPTAHDNASIAGTLSATLAANGSQYAETAALSAAERLFYHQLARVRPELTVATLSTADRTAVAQICQIVEGMPLALELAATQLRTATLDELVGGIQHNLDLLKVRWRGAHQRHQSMRAVIESSVTTLDEAAQVCLAQLAIFQGGFSFASAQAVVGASVNVLETLLHKSLVRRAGGTLPEQRFDLHTLIRQYAAELLARSSAQQQQTATRYYQHHANLLHDGMAHWQAGTQALTELVPLAQEIDNLNAVGQWLIEQGTTNQRQAYLQDLWELYRLERRLPEIIGLLDDAIAVTERAADGADAALLAQWHRMLGESYHILGEFAESRRHFEATLHVLALPLASGGIDLLLTLQRQGLQQVLNRLGRLNLFRRATAAQAVQPGLLDAIEAYRQLVDISLFSGDLMRLVNSALYALNLAEQTADPAALALTYGLMCLMTSAVPGLKLGQMYEQLTVKQLPLVKAPERQIDIAIYLSAYYAGQGEWSRLDTLMQRAVAQSQALHAYRRWGYCQAIWASTFIYRGQFVEGLRAWRTLYEQSLASDSFLFILPAWAAGGMALCNVRLGAWQQAIERAEQGLTHLQGKDDALGRARCSVAIAMARVMREEHQLALDAADQAVALLRDKRPTNYAALECYAWVAEAYLALWQQLLWSAAATPQTVPFLLCAETDQPLTAKALQTSARSALKALQSYAQVFPIGRPSAALAKGTYAWLAGREADAYAAWRQCIELATTAAMRYELGRAHHQLAHYLPHGDPHRATHLSAAETIFTDLHTLHELPTNPA